MNYVYVMIGIIIGMTPRWVEWWISRRNARKIKRPREIDWVKLKNWVDARTRTEGDIEVDAKDLDERNYEPGEVAYIIPDRQTGQPDK